MISRSVNRVLTDCCKHDVNLLTVGERVYPHFVCHKHKEVVIKILRNYPCILFNFNNLMMNKLFSVN